MTDRVPSWRMPIAGWLLLAACSRGNPDDVLTPDPTAHEKVVFWTRAAGGAWEFHPTPIAWHWSSLHAAVVDDEIVLAGLNRSHVPTAWEERFRRLFIDTLVSRDGVTWATRRYWGSGEMGLVDPAVVEDDRGLAAWFVDSPGFTGDPADTHRLNRFIRAPIDGTSLGETEEWTTTQAVVDPAPVVFNGQLHVYGTRHSGEIVEVSKDGEVHPVWAKATVPFARVKDGQLELIAQSSVRWVTGDRAEDRRLPHVRRSVDGVEWSQPELITADDRVRNCASPVLVDFHAIEYLFCVDEGGVPPPAVPQPTVQPKPPDDRPGPAGSAPRKYAPPTPR